MTAPENTEPAKTGRRPFWKSWSILIALGMVVTGLVTWKHTPPEKSPQAGLPGGGAAFAESSSAKSESSKAAAPGSPALFRFGASYMAGFFFGWICRKSIKFGMLVLGAAAVAVLAAKQTGLVEMDWTSLQAHISQSLAWLHGELGAVKQFLLGYIPSTAAGCCGIFMGARHS